MIITFSLKRIYFKLVIFMERYVFLFKRQQYEYLTKSVALASGALLLTSVATAVGLLFAKDAIEASVFSGTFAWLLFFVPALTVRYRHFICGRIPFRLFLPLTALTVSLPMVWIVAKAGLPLTLLALASAAALFFYTLRRGMQVNRTRSIISLFYLMFVCVGVCSLLEAAVAMFNGGGSSMYATFVVAAVIFGKINVHDVFRFRTRLPEGTALEEKEIDKVVEETALSLYLNFIGMIFVADFMKFVVKLLAETPKKRVSD